MDKSGGMYKNNSALTFHLDRGIHHIRELFSMNELPLTDKEYLEIRILRVVLFEKISAKKWRNCNL